MFAANAVVSQIPSYTLRATVVATDHLVIGGLKLQISGKDGGTSVTTDPNGGFSLVALPGDYEITAPGIPKEKFRVFLKVSGTWPNPQDVRLPMDTSALCSSPKLPNILSGGKAVYPPAARARSEQQVL